jgi:hypothetical protein
VAAETIPTIAAKPAQFELSGAFGVRNSSDLWDHKAELERLLVDRARATMP